MRVLSNSRRLVSLGVGVIVGGGLAILSWIVWFTLGPSSLDFTSPSSFQTAGPTQSQLAFPGSRIFDDLKDSESNFELTASLYSVLVSKDESDLLRLLNHSAYIESKTVRRSVQSVVFERFVDIDPIMALQHALDLRGQQRLDSLETVFHEWSLSDLNGAVDAGISLGHPFTRVALRMVVRNSRDLSDEMRRDIEHHLGDDNFIQTVMAEERIWLRTENPEQAWNAVIGDGTQLTSRIGLLARIAEVWWREDSEGMLQKIVESTEPISHHWTSDTYIVLRLLVQALAEHSPEEVFNQAANLAEPFRDALLHAVFEHWSLFDPRAAFNSAFEYELDDRRYALTRVVAQAWARSNPRELIESVSSFAQPLRGVAIKEAILSLGRTDRDEAIKVLKDSQNKGFNVADIWDQFISDWMKEDSNAVIQWYLSNQELAEDERETILRVVVRNTAQIDSQRALELIYTHQSDQSTIHIEAELVRTLALADIEAAISLLPNLRTESKLSSFSAVGGVLVHLDRPMRALGLAGLLPQDQRLEYYSRIFLQWSRNNPKHLMEAIESFAMSELKTMAAEALSQTHAGNPVLSSAEIEYVRNFLDEK